MDIQKKDIYLKDGIQEKKIRKAKPIKENPEDVDDNDDEDDEDDDLDENQNAQPVDVNDSRSFKKVPAYFDSPIPLLFRLFPFFQRLKFRFSPKYSH